MVATEHAKGGGSKGHGLRRRGGQGAWVKGRVVGVVLGEGGGGWGQCRGGLKCHSTPK